MSLGFGLAYLTLKWPDDRRLPKLIAFPGYVFTSVLAGWKAWWQLLRNEKSAVWEPTQRPATASSTVVGVQH
jgi:hypothetical protein